MKRVILILTLAILGLSTNFTVQAQLGGVLKKAKEKTKEVVKEAADPKKSTSMTETVTQKATQAALPEEQRIAIAKVLDESKREVPPVEMLGHNAEERGGAIRKFMGDSISRLPSERVQQVKAKIDARHNENKAIYCALWEVPDDCDAFIEEQDFDRDQLKMKPGVKEAINDYFAIERLLKELNRYQIIISSAKQQVTQLADISIEGDMLKGANTTINRLSVGLNLLGTRDGKYIFLRRDEFGNGIITPAEDVMYEQERTKYINLGNILRKADPEAKQYTEYWKADIAASAIFRAQRNSYAMMERKPVPASQMNNPTLNAKMLKLAQQAYPTSGIVKLIIVESAWRPETNALGVIIHRRINTNIILPKGKDVYIMRTLSFIEPHTGGGKYGEVQAFGIGTDDVAVDYKP